MTEALTKSVTDAKNGTVRQKQCLQNPIGLGGQIKHTEIEIALKSQTKTRNFCLKKSLKISILAVRF